MDDQPDITELTTKNVKHALGICFIARHSIGHDNRPLVWRCLTELKRRGL